MIGIVETLLALALAASGATEDSVAVQAALAYARYRLAEAGCEYVRWDYSEGDVIAIGHCGQDDWRAGWWYQTPEGYVFELARP